MTHTLHSTIVLHSMGTTWGIVKVNEAMSLSFGTPPTMYVPIGTQEMDAD